MRIQCKLLQLVRSVVAKITIILDNPIYLIPHLSLVMIVNMMSQK